MNITQLRIYPVKSFDGFAVSEAYFSSSGGFECDRMYRLLRASDRKPIRTKEEARLLQIRASYILELGELYLSASGQPDLCSLFEDYRKISAWLSRFLGYEVLFEGSPFHYYPDDDVASGPTLVSEESLLAVEGRFGFDRRECLARFRPNIIVSAPELPAFWEEALVGSTFSLNEARLKATNVCARCIVPTRHPETGEMLSGFAKNFAAWRKEIVPAWSRGLDHFYRFTLNTLVEPESIGTRLALSDREIQVATSLAQVSSAIQ